MAEKFICTGCGRDAIEDDYNYCTTCESYKYFAWVEDDDE